MKDFVDEPRWRSMKPLNPWEDKPGQWFLNGLPVSLESLAGEGTDLRTAIAGIFPADDRHVESFITDVASGLNGWRLTFDGPVPGFPDDRAVQFAAPASGGWFTATFVPQDDGGWSALLSGGAPNLPNPR